MSVKTLGISIVIGAALGNRYFSTFDKAEKRAFKLGKAFRETNKKLDASREVIAYQKKLQSLQNFQGNLGQSSDKMKRRIAAAGLALETSRRRAREYGLSIANITREEQRLSSETRRLEKNLERSRKAMDAKARLGALRNRALAGIGLGFAAGQKIGDAFDIQRKRLRLETVINSDDTAKSIQMSLRHSIEFAQRSLATQGELLDIEYSLNSAGLDDSAARAGSEIVSKLAKVTDGVSEEVGVIIGDSFQNFQSQMTGTVDDKMQRFGNILLKTQQRFSIKNFSQLGESIKEGSSAAIGAKIPFEQFSAAVGQLNSAGIKGSKAGTSFKALVGQMIQKQDKLGISIIKTRDGNTDFIATLEQLQTRMKKVGGATEQLAFLQETLGTQGADAAILLLNNMTALTKGYDFVLSKNNKLDQDYKKFINSASGQWDMFNQNISLVGTTLSGTLLPALNAVLTPLAGAAGSLATLSQEYPVLGQALAVATLAFVAYGTILTAVAVAQWAHNSAVIASSNSIIGNIARLVWNKSVILASTVATQAMTIAQWGWNAALSANPIGLVIAGVTAFGALAYTVYKNWEPIKQFFMDLWNTVGQVVENITSFFGGSGNQAAGSRKSRRGAALGAALAAPAAALPASAANVQPNQVVNQQQYHFQVTQQPGEDSEALARRIVEIQQEDNMREEADV